MYYNMTILRQSIRMKKYWDEKVTGNLGKSCKVFREVIIRAAIKI